MPCSGAVVSPTSTAPAARRRATSAQSNSATAPASAYGTDAFVSGQPFTWASSLTPIGMPGERARVIAGGDALRRRVGVRPRLIRVEEAHGVEPRIEALDPRQRELQQVPGAQLTGTDAIGELPRIVLP